MRVASQREVRNSSARYTVRLPEGRYSLTGRCGAVRIFDMVTTVDPNRHHAYAWWR